MTKIFMKYDVYMADKKNIANVDKVSKQRFSIVAN